MTTLLNYKVTLEYLAWLGYEGATTEALRVVPQGKRMDRSVRTQRDTFLVWVLGATGSGKTAFCRRFIRKAPAARYAPTVSPYHVANSVPLEGTERYLVMEEISTHGSLDKEFLADKSLLQMVDSVCFLYDQSDAASFSHIIKLRRENPQLACLPSLVVATKTDCPSVAQNSSESPMDYCKANSIPGPYAVSAQEDEDLGQVPAHLLELALRPPRYQDRASSWWTPAVLTTVLGAGLAGAYYYYMYHKKHPSN
jgi:Ras family protein T1